MRKLLMAAAIAGLVFAIAVPAMALDFKFGSEYRVRFYEGVNGGNSGSAFQTVGTKDVTPRGVQVRVRPRFDVSDDNGNIQATLRLEIGDVEFGNGGGAAGQTNPGPTGNVGQGGARTGNGAGGGLGADGVNVETKWAYLDAALPFNLPARIRAGIQPWYLPKGIIMDDDASGVRIYGKIAPVSYDLAWFRVNGGFNGSAAQFCTNNLTGAVTVATTSTLTGVLACPAGTTAGGAAFNSTAVATSNTIDNNFDFYQAKVDLALAKVFNPGAYFLYGRNASTSPVPPAGFDPANIYYFGATATGDAGILTYDVDFVYGIASGGMSGTFPETTRGWALDGAVHIPVGPLTVNLAGAYGTGDKRDGGKSEAFPSISASWNGAGGGFEMIGSGGPFDAVEFTQDAPTNIWMLGGWITYVPVKPLTLKLAYAYSGFANKNGNCAAAGANLCYGPGYGQLVGKKTIGQELSLRADYKVWTGFTIQGQLAWMFLPSNDAVANHSKYAAEYVLQLLYNF